MRKQTARKLDLNRETVRVLSDRQLPAAVGGAEDIRQVTGDTCLCAPTYWETCQ